ncbi:Mft1p NDAI_0D03020 [Naumovozyma dairenensis CBS 421]|uniref:THO complex subunit MFT1 n=1 Tax=Naumovozyma dairenensis (strain ATCC 10597 / BCRC 20456 / CBS 421 / NBRC 0211 / NRRL Y-12639) TaxID=1071378 RepID=G0WA05_NAUDC|nr:hypothetical protein NDAI_0D03020 [Naumovozyma dairenensis CBS 421]CCD24616.1 hypothetical protein NDAI_0D03020 [Naumovozyma dairenensis CBS 421]
MSLTAQEINNIELKVEYNEQDTASTKYLDTLSKISTLTSSILHGTLTDDTELNNVEDLELEMELRYMELANSVEVRKINFENFETSNSKNFEQMAEKQLPALKKFNQLTLDRLLKVQRLYEAVAMINLEIEDLSAGRTKLILKKSDWIDELGEELTETLIKRKYLTFEKGYEAREDDPLLRAYDDFSKGPKELRRTNESLKEEISRLTEEVKVYKNKWLQNAEIFTRVTSVLKDELKKRLDHDSLETKEQQEEFDDYEDEEETARYKRQREIENSDQEERDDENEQEDLQDIENENIPMSDNEGVDEEPIIDAIIQDDEATEMRNSLHESESEKNSDQEKGDENVISGDENNDDHSLELIGENDEVKDDPMDDEDNTNSRVEEKGTEEHEDE